MARRYFSAEFKTEAVRQVVKLRRLEADMWHVAHCPGYQKLTFSCYRHVRTPCVP